MDEIYLSPQPNLTEEDALLIERIAEIIEPISKNLHLAFSQSTAGCKPFIYLVNCYLALDNTLCVLDNYRSTVVEMVEDHEELSNEAIKLTETIKGCESIQEQIIRAAACVFEVDDLLFDNEKYHDSLVEKLTDLKLKNDSYSIKDEQLELQL